MKCLLCNNDTSFIIANKLRNGNKKNVYYCKKCDLGMLDYKRSDKDLKIFYNRNYRKEFKPRLNKAPDLKELFDIYSNFQANRIKLIKKFLTKKMKLLEIGCSVGMFLFHVKKYVKEITGIDYDSESAHFASRKCLSPIFDVDIENTNLKEKTFDIICMFQVLEHIKNPYEFLMKYRKYLKPNGIIYVEVPNLHDALIYAYGLPNHYNFYFHKAHLWYFTAKSLKILMKKVGFDGRIYCAQDYNILNHMHWISVDAPQDDCIFGLSLPRLPLRGQLGSHKKKELNNFIMRMDFEYKKILTKLGIASNLSFIGRKR
ncbi:class I SAM-dependent methyltransferase [Candidatus Omnitrophota bacterium]